MAKILYTLCRYQRVLFFWFLQNITHWLCIFAIHPAKLCKMRKQKRNCGNKNDLTLIKKPLSAAATTTTKYAWKYRAQQNLSLPADAWKAAHFLHFRSRARQSHTHIYVCYLSVCQSLSMSMCVCVCVFGLLFYARHQVMGVAKAWQNLMKNYEIYLSFRRQRCVQHFTPIWWPSLLVKYMSMDIYICRYVYICNPINSNIHIPIYIWYTHIYI